MCRISKMDVLTHALEILVNPKNYSDKDKCYVVHNWYKVNDYKVCKKVKKYKKKGLWLL